MERVTTYMDSGNLAVVAGDNLHGVPGKAGGDGLDGVGSWEGEMGRVHGSRESEVVKWTYFIYIFLTRFISNSDRNSHGIYASKCEIDERSTQSSRYVEICVSCDFKHGI